VPQPVSVVGCGGEEVVDLTTCQTDWYDMGRRAVGMLRQQLADPQRPAEHSRLAPQMRLGKTTAPLQVTP